jgi:hypothetical protein
MTGLCQHASLNVVLDGLMTIRSCPNCGASLVAPEASELVDGREIRHYWICDDCGAESCTTIDLLPQ